LLQEGGERRLNVAITRARRRMTVVSSFSHADMDPARSNARGVQLLRGYLQYADLCGRGSVSRQAETPGDLPLSGTGRNACPTGDPLLADMQAALGAAGLKLTAHLGASRYRVDLAAAREHDPSRYALAIETDGPTYAAAPTARERDRLRRGQLEALGWRCHRLWSGDWMADRAGEVKRVIEAMKESERVSGDG
jgi:very-short-patch-repair endonuclease